MINYNRKLLYERETHRMSILVLLETLILIKNCKRQCHATNVFYVQYQIPQLILIANPIKQPLAFQLFMHLWILPSGLKQ